MKYRRKSFTGTEEKNIPRYEAKLRKHILALMYDRILCKQCLQRNGL